MGIRYSRLCCDADEETTAIEIFDFEKAFPKMKLSQKTRYDENSEFLG